MFVYVIYLGLKGLPLAVLWALCVDYQDTRNPVLCILGCTGTDRPGRDSETSPRDARAVQHKPILKGPKDPKIGYYIRNRNYGFG